MLRALALRFARQAWLRNVVLTTPGLRDIAWRFVAGEDLTAALAAVVALNDRGLTGTVNFVGWHVRDPEAAAAATERAIESLRQIRDQGVDANVSIKLTQIGFDINETLCRSNLIRILDAATETATFVRIDMEEAAYLEATLRLFGEMLDRFGNQTVGIVMQSYLRSPSPQLDELMARGTRIRLVKGCYKEDAGTIFRSKADVDAMYLRDIETVLRRGDHPAIATHDESAIAHAIAIQRELGLTVDAFEFQMLYGVRPALQDRLVHDGYHVRCYVPYGVQWTGYVVDCVRRFLAGPLIRLRDRARPRRPDPRPG